MSSYISTYNEREIEGFARKRHEHIAQSPFERYRLELMGLLFDNSIKGMVLDIGCNIGEGTRTYKHRAKKAVLMDKELFLLKCAGRFNKDLTNLSFVCADLANLPFRGSSFDSIILTEVLEHQPKGIHNEILEEILRIAKDGCTIFISTPNRLSVPALEGKFIKIFFRNYIWNAWDDTHQYIYSSKEFINFLSSRGLQIKDWLGYYFLPGSLLIRLPKKMQQVLGYLSFLVSRHLGRTFPFKYLGFSTIVQLQKLASRM
ncbi:class I SAM-dependent methyltransferase [Candidatus Omnitrophota bacterium]